MDSSLTVETRIFNTADRSAPIRTIQQDVDVGQCGGFSRAELAAVSVGREVDSLVLLEIIKKKRTRGWRALWRRIALW